MVIFHCYVSSPEGNNFKRMFFGGVEMAGKYMKIQYFEIQFYDIIGAVYAHFVVPNSIRSMQASIMSKQIELADCFRQSVLQLFEGDSLAIFLHFQSFLIALCSHPGRILRVSHLGER